MITLKTGEQIARMREAGRVTAGALDAVSRAVKVGVTTLELDKIAEDFIRSHGGIPSFKGYNGFPGTICASVNEQVVHGFPTEYKLREGDIISVDCGAIVDGWQGDAARTFGVGEISEEAQFLLDVTKKSFFKGLEECYVRKRIGDIGAAVQTYVEANGCSVVRDLCGHGIGREMHESPDVPNFGRAGHGLRLSKGLVIAIEPMVNYGSWPVRTLSNGWTVVTADGSLSAHYENTVAITDGEPEILTLL